MAYRVFLSHSGADFQVAEWIAAHSKAIGIEIYLFEFDSQPGSVVSQKIKDSIEAADALVVLLTKNSQTSPYVQQEIGYAEALKRLIVPIVFKGFDGQKLAMLQGREYVSFDPSCPQLALQSLLTFLSNKKQEKESSQAALVALGALLLLAAFGGSNR